MNNIQLGTLGENAAADYLQRNRYRILERNYRCRSGELDIIAAIAHTLVFVEVKTRRSLSCGYPAEAVTYHKRQKIISTACQYLSSHTQPWPNCRFDVIEIYLLPLNVIKYNHIINAFSV